MVFIRAVRGDVLAEIAAVADSERHAPLFFTDFRNVRVVDALYAVDAVVRRHKARRAAFAHGGLKRF